MAGVLIEIRDEHLKKTLAWLVYRLVDLGRAMTEIGGMLVDSVHHRFGTQQDPEGRPWKPLSFVTLLGRAGKNPIRERVRIKGEDYIKLSARAERLIANAKILLKSARLYKSITFRADGRGVRVGSNLVSARIHQFGGDAGRGHKVKIPARPYLGLPAADQRGIVRILGRHFGGAA